jgi:hypothetical protein
VHIDFAIGAGSSASPAYAVALRVRTYLRMVDIEEVLFAIGGA